MPLNKYALLRYRIIDRTIRQRSYPDIEALREACEEALYNSGGERVSRSTIEKDLRAMRQEHELAYHAPIRFNKRYGGYEYTDPEYTLDDVPLTEDDVETIKFALSTLKQFKGVGMFKKLDSAISKVVDKTIVNPDWEQKTQSAIPVQFETSPENTGSIYLSDVLMAIEENRVVTFSYLKAGALQAEKRELCPLMLKEYGQRWYMVGTEPKKDRIKTFGLDRVETLKVTERYFAPLKNFKPNSYFKHSVGITVTDREPEEIELLFKNSQRYFIESVPLHESQEITEEKEDTFKVTITVSPSYEFYRELLSYGDNLEVLSPASVRAEISQILGRALNNYPKR